MHLLFLDESGTAPGPCKNKHKYFVIAGLAIPEGQWHHLNDSLLGMKTRRGLRGELKWRYFAPGNNENANPMLGLPQAERNTIREEIYTKIIGPSRSIKAIACVCCVEAAYTLSTIKNSADLYAGTYKPVSERFQYYLQDMSRIVGRQEYGIIVADHRGIGDDNRLRDDHEKMVEGKGSHTSKYRNIIESLFLQPSHLSVGIQLADMIAGAVWRKFEKNDNRWYDLIKNVFRCSPKGQIEGFGVTKFPKAGWK